MWVPVPREARGGHECGETEGACLRQGSMGGWPGSAGARSGIAVGAEIPRVPTFLFPTLLRLL